MTRENAKLLLPIIQAYAEGKTIQFRHYKVTPWTDAVQPLSFNDDYLYRIKPEPRRFWVNVYPKNTPLEFILHRSKDLADSNMIKDSRIECIEVVEVITNNK